MINVRVDDRSAGRISQGDIFRDVDCIEHVSEKSGTIEVSKIIFPLVVVLTQDCDLQQDSSYRVGETAPAVQDKKLFAVLVAPLYNAEQVFRGEHLSDLDLKMEEINKQRSPGKMLMNNERPRYHYFDFPSEVPIVPSIIDFKHYFSVSVNYLVEIQSKRFVCRISELFREDLSLRFAGYLARIGLPEIANAKAGQGVVPPGSAQPTSST